MCKSKIHILLMIILLTVLLSSFASSQVSAATNLNSFYGAYIDKCILKCDSKASMRDSNLKHIQQASARYCLKAAFLLRHKVKLIEELIANNIGTKPYKIDYYLNSRFFKELKMALNTL